MEVNNAKLLVLGGARLVGSHIVDQLINEPVSEIIVFDIFVRGTRANLANALKDVQVRIVDASITDQAALHQVMTKVNGGFHLASLWLGTCVNEPCRAWKENVLGTWNIIEECLGKAPCSLIETICSVAAELLMLWEEKLKLIPAIRVAHCQTLLEG